MKAPWAVVVTLLVSTVPGSADQAESGSWQPLFDGRSLHGWVETPFQGRGAVRVENQTITLGAGRMTGINWTGSFPHSDYEIRLEAVRLQGHDFFAGITFPVGDSFCTWINGGWGGEIVGLSSLDDLDAVSNETGKAIKFELGRWYSFRLRVTAETITAWIDERLVIDVDLANRSVGLRPGPIELSKPLGIASYQTAAALRKIEYRLLPDGPEP